MQSALFGFAITVILVLVTALVGPYFVDWASYRAEFEATASRLTGLDLRVAGPIDLSILPVPTVTLQQIAFARPGEPAATRAQALRIEFSLPALISGQLRAADLTLQGPELTVKMNGSGRLDLSTPAIGFDPDAVSIDHLAVEDGRVTLADSASGGQIKIEKLAFTGQVSSLRGPVKGQGSLTLDGRRYPYRLTLGRAGDGGAAKLRLSFDPADDPRSAEFDGSVWLDRGIPHFDGALQSTGAGPPGVAALAGHDNEPASEPWNLPWHFTSHVHGDSTAVALEQIDLQYGMDEQALELRGDANLALGPKPALSAMLSTPMIDLDRMLALPDAVARRPLAAGSQLIEALMRIQHLPIDMRLGLSADTVTLAGAPLQGAGGELTNDGDGWTIESFGFRAPGLTQVAFNGRLGRTPEGVTFNGATKIDSADPRVLASWLADQRIVSHAGSGPLSVASDLSVGRGTIALDRLHATLDRMTVEGRLDYSLPAGDRPARVNAALRAPQFDLDRVQALLKGLGDLPLEWPREGALQIEIGQALMSGIEAKDVAVKVRRDAGGLDIDRLAIGDVGGAKLAVTGHFDTRESAPHGAMTLDLDASNLDGVAALVGKVSTAAADRIHRIALHSAPTKLHAGLTVDQDRPGPAAAGTTIAKFSLAGNAGVFRLDLQGDDTLGNPAVADLMASNLSGSAKLGGSTINLSGHLDAGDGSALVGLLGLDRLVAVDKRAGRLSFNARGALDGDLAVGATLAAGGVGASANGTARLPGVIGGQPSLEVALKVAADAIQGLHAIPAPHAGLPSTLTARLALGDSSLSLSDVDGTLAGTTVKGRLGIALTQPMRLDGDLAIGTLDLPAALAAAIGAPPAGPSGDGVWPAEPFEQGLLTGANGQIKLDVGRLTLTPKLAARDVRAVLNLEPSGIAVANIDGGLAGGRVTGDFSFERGPDGVTARSHLGLAGSDAAQFVAADGKPPLTGRLDVDLDFGGSGRSPVALIGSLAGSGRFTLQDGGIARLDPTAFAGIMRAVDQGLPPDAVRIGDRMEAALSHSMLPVAMAQGMITIDMGQVSVPDVAVRAKGAELALAGNVDLAQYAIDARLTLSGPSPEDVETGGRPEVTVNLKGPIDAPKRQLNVATLATWLALRAADQKIKRLDALQATRDSEADPADATSSAPSEHTVAVPAAPAATPPAARPRPRPSIVDQMQPPMDIRPLPALRPLRSESNGTRVDGSARLPSRPATRMPNAAVTSGPIGP